MKGPFSILIEVRDGPIRSMLEASLALVEQRG